MSVLLHHCQSASVLLLQQLFTAKDKRVSQAPGDDVFRGLLELFWGLPQPAQTLCWSTFMLMQCHSDAHIKAQSRPEDAYITRGSTVTLHRV